MVEEFKRECRICYAGEEEGQLFKPCRCAGTMMYVHIKCLDKWRSTGPNQEVACPQCRYQYNLRTLQISGWLGQFWVVPALTMLIFLFAWALCSVVCFLVFFFGIIDIEVLFRMDPSDIHVGIVTYMMLGLALLGLFGVGFSCMLDGWGDLLRLQLHGTDGPVSIVIICVFLAIGVIRALSCIYQKVFQYASGARDSLRTYVLDIREVEAAVSKSDGQCAS
jgi:hypothetical protein